MVVSSPAVRTLCNAREQSMLADVGHLLEHGMIMYKGFPAPLICDFRCVPSDSLGDRPFDSVACRIVYVVDEADRFGFAYGTLPAHAETGEERFTVEWDEQDDAVWYDILAFSLPQQLLARLGYPFARRLQKRFARDSPAAMLRAVVEGRSTAQVKSDLSPG
jgi:hypothetical protein